jgi:hypothetical protein
MTPFKFLNDNEITLIELDSGLASWLWSSDHDFVSPEDWEITTLQTNGIIEFLSSFEEYTIVPIHRITSHATGRIHGPGFLVDEPWGFNIQREPIEIQYYRHVGNYPD